MASLEATRARFRITPLSAEDIAQIKSSITVTSLNDVVLGLLCNALDANASRVVVEVCSSRGTCTVEDNGEGIPVDEFEEHGGLLKCYRT